jgi:hypothetical protein
MEITQLLAEVRRGDHEALDTQALEHCPDPGRIVCKAVLK